MVGTTAELLPAEDWVSLTCRKASNASTYGTRMIELTQSTIRRFYFGVRLSQKGRSPEWMFLICWARLYIAFSTPARHHNEQGGYTPASTKHRLDATVPISRSAVGLS